MRYEVLTFDPESWMTISASMHFQLKKFDLYNPQVFRNDRVSHCKSLGSKRGAHDTRELE